MDAGLCHDLCGGPAREADTYGMADCELYLLQRLCPDQKGMLEGIYA